MPNTREKLIKIVREKATEMPGLGVSATQTLRFVDYLIANGVTIGKQIDTNADRIRAMSDEELADVVVCPHTGNWDLCRVRFGRRS